MPEPRQKPAIFHDDLGRQWSLRLTIGHALEIEEQTGISVFCHDEPGRPFAFLGKTAETAEVLWRLIEPQAKAQGIATKRQFLDAMDGDNFAAAVTALLEAIGRCYPTTTAAAMVAAWKDQAKRTTAAASNLARNSPTPTPVASGSGFGPLPAKSESTQP